MCKMWRTLCLVSLLSTLAQCTPPFVYRTVQGKAVAPVTPQAAASSLPPTLNPSQSLAVLGIDSQLLQDVFGAPNQLPTAQQEATDAADAGLDDFRPSYAPYDEFDWRLTKHVASITDQNLLLSPLGLKLALAILTEAATGITAAELQFVLGFGTNASYVQKKFENMLDSLLTKSNQYILDLGSRIYVGNGAQTSQKFAATAEQHYKTEVRKADFDHPAAAVKEINSWIWNITHGRIPKLVSEDDVSDAVMMVLNTLYFKGTWRHQFAPNDTRLDNFFSSASNVVEVPFMTMEENFFYAESIKMEAKILRLPYLGNKFSMYLIVPNSIAGLSRVLQELTSHQLRQEMAFLTQRKVRVMLPRFQFEFASQLDNVLKDLGIRQAFEPTASFPGISRGNKLDQMIRISRVMQKSGIEVNELGSVVYTATEIALVNRFGDGDEGTVEVKANKPFLFFIEDESSRQLLFTGRISNPAASNAAH